MGENGERAAQGGDKKSNSRDSSLKLSDFGISNVQILLGPQQVKK
jgi:hypothetical protein